MKYLLLALCLIAYAPAQIREHGESSIVFRLAAPPSAVLPLFGPIRESEWAADWNPTMLYPTDGTQKAGAVFITRQHDQDVVWMLTVFDETASRAEYVHVWPDMCATRLDIRLKAIGENESEAAVTYQLTSLSERGDAYVKHFIADFPSQRGHWQKALGDRLLELRTH